jgi:hypothetical protein
VKIASNIAKESGIGHSRHAAGGVDENLTIGAHDLAAGESAP